MFSANVFATGIGATSGAADPATCDTDTLGTATGPANLRAEFTPEIINLRWYDGNERVNVPSTSNTCTYDTAISLPSNPTKPGYKFKGWKVINILTTLDADINGTALSLTGKEWSASFSYGTIYGTSLCSGTSGAGFGKIGSPENTDGRNCWCRVTDFAPTGENKISTPYSSWVFMFLRSDCANDCALHCRFYAVRGNDSPTENGAVFRRGLYSQSNN